ncbi:hypothetical protein [Novosphingobium beihaiensis]|uniref:Uncharacterized protein n=1 Tax=Novosphingobium beihaiensis TaxID=2930389 RepID=A0ABT0BJQ6_9SPHN|nr:hypothetical protein [Novosphingobium beihaiensis]MCJ2185272.1 hypothetical protein [Novosphingobium beihaiensis]
MNAKTLTVAALSISTAALPIAGTAFAAAPATPQILSRDAHGRATQVRVDGQAYPVCEGSVQDECINPRQAGLRFGDVPLGYWPGQLASDS